MATIVACVTAIVVMEDQPDETSQSAPATAADTTGPGLISFATPSKGGTTPPGGGKRHQSAERPTTPTPTHRATTPPPSRKPTKSPAPDRTSPAPKPTPAGTSLRSVNYPDRYWHVRDGYVRLDEIGSGPEQREDSTFQRVKGLADSSCSSFVTADGRYLRHRSFVLVKDRNDGSSLFRADATFCPRPSPYYSGAVMLESVNYPGRFLRHQNFQLKLDAFQNTYQYVADSTFRMVAGLA
jgi:hypothetical protein